MPSETSKFFEFTSGYEFKDSNRRVTHILCNPNKIRHLLTFFVTVDEFVEKYDIEIVLTRLLLKSMIEFLS